MAAASSMAPRQASTRSPACVEAVRGRIPVLVDGGIRRGADVVKALALGAAACLIGRPHLWGLAMSGEAGVAHVLDIYRREIDRVLGLCGISRIADIGPDLIFRRPVLGWAIAAPSAYSAASLQPSRVNGGIRPKPGYSALRVARAAASSAASSSTGMARRSSARASSDFTVEYDRFVDRAGDAERPRFGEQGAVERVDLGATALLDVLKHRGAVVALPGVVEDGGARIGIGQRDPLGRDDREHLVENAFEETPCRLGPRHLAGAEAGNGGDRIDRDVEDELHPDVADDVVADRGRQAGLLKSAAMAATRSDRLPSSSPIVVLPTFEWSTRPGARRAALL